ncbi:MAG: Phosphatidylserine synthase [uncultured bacterium]|nr:MAG: Phosphatidylserine synthase [uncultured bacterium]OGT53985.1 MAG: CDP-diacylglycerol--serine O-phosphatidyltransferase [Gammaproteobacteria bacterium RIFCSPHIGHO2_12_FULL_42_10]
MSDEIELLEKIPQRGIYLLPNLLTTAALFAGFYAIVAAMKGLFDTAAIAIFIAMIADALDGRVARMTNTQSSFGAQYDSLSDMISFGAAPALVLYSWSLFHLGKIGWLAAFLYTAGAALRLARFNTQSHDKCYFQGLPSTLAAGFMASVIWLLSNYGISGYYAAPPVALITLFTAALMVSTIRYTSFKSVDLKSRVSFMTAVIIVLLLAALAWYPPEMLFITFTVYVCSGPIVTLRQIHKMKKQRRSELMKHKRSRV